MNSIKKILAITFVTLLLYVDIGLLFNINHGLHAHIVANNQILIHYHNNPGTTHDTHHSNDCNPGTFALYSTLLTFLDNGQTIYIREYFNIIHSSLVSIDFVIPTTKQINISLLRAPPYYFI